MTSENLNILLPQHVRAMLDSEAKAVDEQPPEARGKFLPQPVGYKMLLILPEQNAAYESGILKADNTKQADEVASVVAFVAKQGPDCYKDKAKFPNGPWCKEGDFVIIRPYGGTRIVVHGKEMRLVNDDSIEAVVDDPRGIKRVGG
jgi:co-chaperonin GroES (HSP10)